MGFRFPLMDRIASITISDLDWLGSRFKLGINSREDRTLRLSGNDNVHVTSCATHTV
jgi:hypothetical protein